MQTPYLRKEIRQTELAKNLWCVSVARCSCYVIKLMHRRFWDAGKRMQHLLARFSVNHSTKRSIKICEEHQGREFLTFSLKILQLTWSWNDTLSLSLSLYIYIYICTFLMFGLFSVLYILANSLLRLAVDGKIVMCVYPPGFINKRGKSIGIFSPMIFVSMTWNW